ncbi:MAG: CBS domain-containing protein [Nitrosopumilus sp.]|nr:CBS domain-containing protein [Nitrosopumilus sp.]
MDILTNATDIITVTPDTSINDVLQKMQSNLIKHIIVKAKNKPVGIVTERDIDKFLENDKTARALEEISIEQVMEKNLITITDGASNSISQAAERMHTFKIGSVIIVDSDGNLVGLITKTDIVKVYGTLYGAKFKVKDHMSKKVFTCRESDSLRFALSMINENNITRLVITNNNGRPISVMTSNNFLVYRSYFTKGKTGTREHLLSADSESMCVGDLVSKDLLAVNVEDDLSIAAQKMIKNHIHGMPVIDDADKLVGVVSNSDIVRAFVKVPLTKELLEKYSRLY